MLQYFIKTNITANKLVSILILPLAFSLIALAAPCDFSLEDLLKNGVTIGKSKIVKKEKPAVKLTDFFGGSTKPVMEKKTNETKAKEAKEEEVRPKSHEKSIITESKGKIYVTGSVPGMTKEEIQDFAEELGYEWSTSVSSKLTLLVIGNKPGMAKVDKATDLGVKIISWEKFLSINKD